MNSYLLFTGVSDRDGEWRWGRIQQNDEGRAKG